MNLDEFGINLSCQRGLETFYDENWMELQQICPTSWGVPTPFTQSNIKVQVYTDCVVLSLNGRVGYGKRGRGSLCYSC